MHFKELFINQHDAILFKSSTIWLHKSGIKSFSVSFLSSRAIHAFETLRVSGSTSCANLLHIKPAQYIMITLSMFNV